ncbi:hypothetical protein Tco_0961267 [Tanacetum coccineum]
MSFTKVSPWKCVVSFWPRACGKVKTPDMSRTLSKVVEKVCAVLSSLSFLRAMSRVHNTFHVSNLKKCYSDDPLVVPLGRTAVDDKLFILLRACEGPEFTWTGDQFGRNITTSFTKTAPSSSAAVISLEDQVM